MPHACACRSQGAEGNGEAGDAEAGARRKLQFAGERGAASQAPARAQAQAQAQAQEPLTLTVDFAGDEAYDSAGGPEEGDGEWGENGDGEEGELFEEAEYADEGELLQALVEMGEESLLMPQADAGAHSEAGARSELGAEGGGGGGAGVQEVAANGGVVPRSDTNGVPHLDLAQTEGGEAQGDSRGIGHSRSWEAQAQAQVQEVQQQLEEQRLEAARLRTRIEQLEVRGPPSSLTPLISSAPSSCSA